MCCFLVLTLFVCAVQLNFELAFLWDKDGKSLENIIHYPRGEATALIGIEEWQEWALAVEVICEQADGAEWPLTAVLDRLVLGYHGLYRFARSVRRVILLRRLAGRHWCCAWFPFGVHVMGD